MNQAIICPTCKQKNNLDLVLCQNCHQPLEGMPGGILPFAPPSNRNQERDNSKAFILVFAIPWAVVTVPIALIGTAYLFTYINAPKSYGGPLGIFGCLFGLAIYWGIVLGPLILGLRMSKNAKNKL